MTEEIVCQNICNQFEILRNTEGIICGDFNFPKLVWPDAAFTSKCETVFGDALSDLMLEQQVVFPTRANNVLDLILSNCPERTRTEPAIGFSSSDHNISIVISIDGDFWCDIHQKQSYPDIFKTDYLSINAYLNCINWTVAFNGCNASDCWELFLQFYNFIISTLIPWSVKKRSKNQFPWMRDSGVIRAKKNKKKLWASPKQNGLHSSYCEYQRAASLVAKAVYAARVAFEKRLASNIGRDSKKFFRHAKRFMKLAGRIDQIHDNSGFLLSDNNSVANCINEHFASVFTIEPLDNIPVPRTGRCQLEYN